MLKVEHISTGYGNKQVLFDVSFEVKAGEIALLAGSNGSGKSTLLKVIFGILPAWDSKQYNSIEKHTGKIIFNGEDISNKSTSVLVKKGLLYIPQKNNVFDFLTVRENLEIAGILLDKNTSTQRFEEMLNFFPNLSSQMNNKTFELSGGERQLLALAMITIHKPKLILLDEPFTGLSTHNIELVINYIKYVNDIMKTTLLVAEHRLKECLTIADKVIGLKLGRVVMAKTNSPTLAVNIFNELYL